MAEGVGVGGGGGGGGSSVCVSLLVLSQYVDHNGEEGVVVGVERLSNGDLWQKG